MSGELQQSTASSHAQPADFRPLAEHRSRPAHCQPTDAARLSAMERLPWLRPEQPTTCLPQTRTTRCARPWPSKVETALKTIKVGCCAACRSPAWPRSTMGRGGAADGPHARTRGDRLWLATDRAALIAPPGVLPPRRLVSAWSGAPARRAASVSRLAADAGRHWHWPVLAGSSHLASQLPPRPARRPSSHARRLLPSCAMGNQRVTAPRPRPQPTPPQAGPPRRVPSCWSWSRRTPRARTAGGRRSATASRRRA